MTVFGNPQEIKAKIQTIINETSAKRNYIDGIAIINNNRVIFQPQVIGALSEFPVDNAALLFTKFERTVKDTIFSVRPDQGLDYISLRLYTQNNTMIAWTVYNCNLISAKLTRDYKIVYYGLLEEKSDLCFHQSNADGYTYQQLIPLIEDYDGFQ